MGELEVANACGSPHVKIDNKREQQKRKLNSKPVNTAVGGRFIFLILALHETKNVKIDYNLVTSRHSHAKLNSLKCVLWRGKKKKQTKRPLRYLGQNVVHRSAFFCCSVDGPCSLRDSDVVAVYDVSLD